MASALALPIFKFYPLVVFKRIFVLVVRVLQQVFSLDV